MKVILIDDEPMVLAVLSSLFRRRGYEVATFASPMSCPIFTSANCCAFEAGCPDIIISDVDMPEVSGLQFVETIFSKGCRCKHVALLTGKGIVESDLARIKKFRVRLFLKPLDFDEFNDWLWQSAQTVSEAGVKCRG